MTLWVWAKSICFCTHSSISLASHSSLLSIIYKQWKTNKQNENTKIRQFEKVEKISTKIIIFTIIFNNPPAREVSKDITVLTNGRRCSSGNFINIALESIVFSSARGRRLSLSVNVTIELAVLTRHKQIYSSITGLLSTLFLCAHHFSSKSVCRRRPAFSICFQSIVC